MLQTVHFPWLTDSEQQCRHLQEIRTCQTSRSRQSVWCNNLSAISFTLTPPTPVFSLSSSPMDHYQPLHRELLRPTGGAGIKAPPDAALLLTEKVILLCSTCRVGGSWLLLFLVTARVFVIFNCGGKFSAGASKFIVSDERSLVGAAAGRHPVPDHE